MHLWLLASYTRLRQTGAGGLYVVHCMREHNELAREAPLHYTTLHYSHAELSADHHSEQVHFLRYTIRPLLPVIGACFLVLSAWLASLTNWLLVEKVARLLLGASAIVAANEFV